MVRHGTMTSTMTDETRPARRPHVRQRFLAWPRFARIATYVAGILVILLIAASITAVQLVRRPFPQVSGLSLIHI